jgi:hypothetical protein
VHLLSQLAFLFQPFAEVEYCTTPQAVAQPTIVTTMKNRLVSWVYAASVHSPACGANPGSGSDLRSSFFYDGLGRLRKRIDYTSGCPGDCCWQPVAAVHYICDGMRVIQERNGTDPPMVSYTRSPDLSGTLEGAGGIRGLLARSDVGWARNLNYHSDGNGNITYLETGGSLAASYRYDPFGNTIAKAGSFA